MHVVLKAFVMAAEINDLSSKCKSKTIARDYGCSNHKMCWNTFNHIIHNVFEKHYARYSKITLIESGAVLHFNQKRHHFLYFHFYPFRLNISFLDLDRNSLENERW